MSLTLFSTFDKDSKDISGTNPQEWNEYLKVETAHCYPGEGIIRGNKPIRDQDTIYPRCEGGNVNAPCCDTEQKDINIGYVAVAGKKVNELQNVTTEGIVTDINYTSEDPKDMQIVFSKWFNVLRKNNKLTELSFTTDVSKIPPAGLCHLLRNPNVGLAKSGDKTKFGQEVKISLIWQIAAEQHVLGVARMRDVPFHVVALDYGTGTGKTAIIARCIVSMCSEGVVEEKNKPENAYISYVIWNQKDKNKLQTEVINLLSEKLEKKKNNAENFTTTHYRKNFYQKDAPNQGTEIFKFDQNVKRVDLPENTMMDTSISPSTGTIEQIDEILTNIKSHVGVLVGYSRRPGYKYLYENIPVNTECRIAIFIDEAHVYMDKNYRRYPIIENLKKELLELQDKHKLELNIRIRFILLSANLSDVAEEIEDFSTSEGKKHLSVVRFTDIPMPFRADVRLAKKYVYQDPKVPIDYTIIEWEDRAIFHTGANLFAEALRRCAILYAKNKIEKERRIKQLIVFSNNGTFFEDAVAAYLPRIQSARGLTINSTTNYITGAKNDDDEDSKKYGGYITNIYSPVPANFVPPPVNTKNKKKTTAAAAAAAAAATVPTPVQLVESVSGPDQSSIGFEFYKVKDEDEADAMKKRFGTLDDFRDENVLHAFGSHKAYEKKQFPKTEILALNVTATGINLAGVSAVHFLGPPKDYTDFIQTVARGIRLCSSIGFEAGEQQLEIHMYGTDKNIEDLKRESQTNAKILDKYQVDGGALSTSNSKFALDGTKPLPYNKLLFEMARINYRNGEMKNFQPTIYLNTPEDILNHMRNYISIKQSWLQYLNEIGKNIDKSNIDYENLSILLINIFSLDSFIQDDFIRYGFENAEALIRVHQLIFQNIIEFANLLSYSYDCYPKSEEKYAEIFDNTAGERLVQYLKFPNEYELVICPRNISKGGTFYDFVHGNEPNLLKCYEVNYLKDKAELIDTNKLELRLAKYFFLSEGMFALLWKNKYKNKENEGIVACLNIYFDPYSPNLTDIYDDVLTPEYVEDNETKIKELCLKIIEMQNVYAISKLNLFDEKYNIWTKVDAEFLKIKKFDQIYILYYYESSEKHAELQNKIRSYTLFTADQAIKLIDEYFNFIDDDDKDDKIKEKIASAFGVWRMFRARQ